MSPLHCNIVAPKKHICMAGMNAAYMRKYAVASLRIAASPPSQRGSGPARPIANIESSSENRVTTRIP